MMFPWILLLTAMARCFLLAQGQFDFQAPPQTFPLPPSPPGPSLPEAPFMPRPQTPWVWPGTCESRCGEMGTADCSCDVNCTNYEQCCSDFQDACPEEYQTSIALNPPPPDFCDPDVTLPDVGSADLPSCGSCQNRCGTKAEYQMNWEHFSPCSCDKHCGFSQDCCPDFQEVCPQEAQLFHFASASFPFERHYEDFKCFSFFASAECDGCMPPSKPFPNHMVHVCADGSQCEYSSQLNDDVNTFVPMYDSNRGVHYISAQCAVCNGARDVIPWGVHLSCSSPLQGFSGGQEINSSQTLKNVTQLAAGGGNRGFFFGNQCRLTYTLMGESRPCLEETPVVSTCPATCGNHDLVTRCETSGGQALTFTSKSDFMAYKNAYCGLCHADVSLKCDRNVFDKWYPASGNTFSLTLVFDFDPRRGLTVGSHSSIPECNTGEVYVPDEDACRLITCPSGYILEISECVPEHSSITAIVTGSVGRVDNPSMYVVKRHETELQDQIYQCVEKTFDESRVSHHNLVVNTFLHHQPNESIVVIEIDVLCNCDFRPLLKNNSDETASEVTRFEQSFAEKLRPLVVWYFWEKAIRMSSVEVNVSLEATQLQHSVLHDPAKACQWLVYQPEEVEVNANGSVKVISTGRTYTSGWYHRSTTGVLVCDTTLRGGDKDKTSSSHTDLVLSIVTIVCVGISILCLVARIALQLIVTSFQSRPGRLHLQLAIAILLAYLMLIIGPFLSDSSVGCKVGAVLLAYGFFAAFVWMNVVAVDTTLAFSPSSAFTRADDSKRHSLGIHLTLGWGVPLLLVIVSIAVNESSIQKKFSPEFGGARCWYTQRYAMLVYFGLPIMLSLMLNLICFVYTAINLRRAFRNAFTATGAQDNHIAVYIRLFVLMGAAWVLGVVSAFTDSVAVDFLFVIMTSLQGLFLFVSFVCTRKVLTEIREKWRLTTTSGGLGLTSRRAQRPTSSPLSPTKSPAPTLTTQTSSQATSQV